MFEKRLFIVIALTLIFTVARSWEPFIFFTDELQLEETSYQMAKTHDFLIPRFDSSPFFIKSPLYSWLTAPLYWFLPPSPIVRRFWTLVFGIGLVLLTYAFSKRFYDDKTAFWASLFLIGNGLYISFTKAANLDIPNAFFTLLIIVFYNLGKKKTRYLYLAGITLGISLLNRSFLALIPIPIIIIDLFLFSREKLKLFPLLLTSCILILVALPWHLYAYTKYPTEFTQQFFGFNLIDHIVRLAPGDSNSPWWLYFTMFVYFPIALLTLVQIVNIVRSKFHRSVDIQLASWFFLLLIGLSILPTRHEWYILPILPPAAILAAQAFVQILISLQNRHQLTLHFLLTFTSLSFTLTPLFSLLTTKDLNAEVIHAVNAMVKNSQPNDILYTYPHPYIYTTTLFHPRTIKTLPNEYSLIKIKRSVQNFYVLGDKKDYQLWSILSEEGQVTYSGKQLLLLYFKDYQ